LSESGRPFTTEEILRMPLEELKQKGIGLSEDEFRAFQETVCRDWVFSDEEYIKIYRMIQEKGGKADTLKDIVGVEVNSAVRFTLRYFLEVRDKEGDQNCDVFALPTTLPPTVGEGKMKRGKVGPGWRPEFFYRWCDLYPSASI